jgi:hypothetical protein
MRKGGSLPVGLHAQPAHQVLAHKDGQHVIAELPLWRRCVDFDAVVKAEQPVRPVAVPDQRVEWRQHGGAVELAGRARVLPDVGRLAPAFDLHLGNVAFLGQFLHGLPGALDRQAEVVADVGLGCNAQCPCRLPCQFAHGIGAVGGRGVEGVFGQNPVRHVVHPFEAIAFGRGHVTGPEQVFQRGLVLVPAPPFA